MATINTTFSFRDEVSNGLRRMRGEVEKTNSGFGQMALKLMGVGSAMQILGTVRNQFNKITMSVNQCVQAYQQQSEQELKLATIMKQRMNATDAEIQSIKEFASAQQRMGIYGDELILQGAQELASFTSNKQAIETLIPAMNNLIAQQYGYSASGMDFQHTADMMGKVLSGQTGALSRLGYVFSEEEKQMLKTGDEMQRASTLAKIITDNVGEMNQALAGTTTGQIQSLSMTMGDLREEIGKSLMPFKQMFNMVTSKWKINFYENIIKALDAITQNMDKVILVIGALGVEVIALGVYFAILKRQAIASALATATAWMIAHAPIALMILGITALIGAIVALLMYSEKTFPAIGGFIGGVAGIAKETGAQIQFYFGKAIEGVVNGFLTMKQKIITVFLNVFDYLLSGVEKVAMAMDKVFGTSFADNINEFRNSLDEMKNAEQQKFSLGWEDNRQGFANAWNSGSEIGKQIGSNLSDKLQDSLDNMTKGFKGIAEDSLSGQDLKVDGSGALIVSDKNLVDIAEDYKEILSKRATERFNLQFRNITPSVNIDHVDIHEEADANKVLSILSNGLSEFASSDLRSAS